MVGGGGMGGGWGVGVWGWVGEGGGGWVGEGGGGWVGGGGYVGGGWGGVGLPKCFLFYFVALFSFSNPTATRYHRAKR